MPCLTASHLSLATCVFLLTQLRAAAGKEQSDMGKQQGRQLEQAKLQWAQGHQAAAVRLANSLLDGAKAGGDAEGYAQMLSLTGKWLAETR